MRQRGRFLHKPFQFTVVLEQDLVAVDEAKALCDCCGQYHADLDIRIKYGPLEVGEYMICRKCDTGPEENQQKAITTNLRRISLSVQLNA